MTSATVIKKTFNWGGLLSVPEVPTIIYQGSVQADVVLEPLTVLHLASSRKSTEILGGFLTIGISKAHHHSDTLPPTRSHLLQQSHTS